MNERLNNIVDLKKYPIHDLNSPEIKELINRCKNELDKFSCSTISNFILPNKIGKCTIRKNIEKSDVLSLLNEELTT